MILRYAGAAKKAIIEGDSDKALSRIEEAIQWASWTEVPSNAVECAAVTEDLGHPAAFPTGVPAWCIRGLSFPNDLILDPFVGSGTTLIAAAENNRNAIGIEMKSDYIEIASERLKSKGIEFSVCKTKNLKKTLSKTLEQVF